MESSDMKKVIRKMKVQKAQGIDGFSKDVEIWKRCSCGVDTMNM